MRVGPITTAADADGTRVVAEVDGVPLWSSNRLQVEHDDATYGRVGKLPAIGRHTLVERHLRVCWENRSETGNCSCCEKCVRTMLALQLSGGLDRSQSFDSSISLSRRLDDIGAVNHDLVKVYEDLRPKVVDPELASAVDRLIRRSRSRWKGPLLRRLYQRRARAFVPQWRPMS